MLNSKQKKKTWGPNSSVAKVLQAWKYQGGDNVIWIILRYSLWTDLLCKTEWWRPENVIVVFNI